jgi:tripartite-type tricarboxylate transporter receptor subunit TctC
MRAAVARSSAAFLLMLFGQTGLARGHLGHAIKIIFPASPGSTTDMCPTLSGSLFQIHDAAVIVG